jgi:recombinational DNA repair ATPase RecF
MSGMGAKCGVVDIFKCPLTVADMKKMHGEVTIQLQDAEADLEALSSGVKGLQGDVTGLETKGAEQKKEYERLTGEVATVKQAITHAEDLAARLAKHQSSSLETGNWPDELAKASEALTAAEIKNLDIQKAQDINASRSLQVTAVRSKQSEAEELKAAVEELAALKETLLKAGSSHFVEEMQAILSEFGFEQVEYSNEPFGFFADGLGAEQLSGGQKVLLEAALRLAAAKASGLNIMALDDANKLGEKARNKLAGILLKAGVQVIICSTTEIRPEPQKLPEGFKILWFTNESPIGPTVVDNIHA